MAQFLTPSGATVDSVTGAMLSGPTGGQNQLSGSYNAGTNAGGSTTKSLTNPGTVSGQTPDTGSSISSTLDSQFAPIGNTIMQNYASAISAASGSAATNAKSITDTGAYNLGYENTQDKNLGTQMQEGGRGFVVNPGAIAVLQTQADKRVRDLTTQMNDALANNNSTLASHTADLIAQEQTAITNARTNFLSQYFQSQGEARAEASFQSPEQQSVMSLASTYPSAGVLPTDSLAAAQAKVANSAQYKQNLAKGAADIAASNASANASNASAGLSSAQAAQINTILKTLKDNGSYDADVSGLTTGAATDATLHAKYDGYPNGMGALIISNIESQAQAKGWNPQQSSLNAAGQKSLTEAANSGNPFSILGAGGTSLLNTAGSKLFSNPTAANPFNLTGSGTTAKTPSGIPYTIH